MRVNILVNKLTGVASAYCSFHDLTGFYKLKKRTEELHKKNMQLENICNFAQVGIFEQSPEGEIFNDNDYAKNLFDSHNDDNRGEGDNWQNYIDPDDVPRIAKIREKSLKEQCGVKFEFKGKKPGGEVFWGRMQTEPYITSKGSFGGWIGVVSNITDLKNKELELKRIISHFETIQTEARIGIWEYEVLSKKIYWSNEIYDLFDRKNKIPPSFDEYVSYIGEGRKEHKKSINSCVVKGKGYTNIYRLLTNQNWILAKGVALKDGKGNVIKLLGTAFDITEIKNKEKQLADINKKLQKTINLSVLAETTSGIAHEISQPLSVISTASFLALKQLVKTKAPNIDNVKEKLQEIEDESIKAGNILHSIKHVFISKSGCRKHKY